MKRRHINFIPLENREKFVIDHKYFPMAMVPTILLYIAVSGGSLMRDSSTSRAEMAKLEKTNEELSQKLKSVSVNERDIEVANALQNILKDKNNWSDIFKELSLLIPDGVWLTGFGNKTITPPKAAVKAVAGAVGSPAIVAAAAALLGSPGERLIIRGEAGNQDKIAEFLTVLEKSKHFSSVQLVLSQKDEDILPTRYQFEFSVRVNKPTAITKGPEPIVTQNGTGGNKQ